MIVTGTASGIGQALAVAYAERRANVVLVDMNQAGMIRLIRKSESGKDPHQLE